jgi:bacillithiol biosynthesis deacetylase BshB1
MPLDLLVFAPHPDDAEIGLGGTMARHARLGHSIGICDLTAGELSSNGTTEIRRQEAEAASRALGLAWRENLGLPDGGLALTPAHVRSIVKVIREQQPRVIALPYWEDRHPDHVAASALVTEAVFKAGLRKYETALPAWSAEWSCYYFINDVEPPSFVVDVSEHYETKRASLACYQSQFAPMTNDAVSTRLTASSFIRMIEGRDAHLGSLCGVAFAEGVVVREPLVRPTLFKASR